MIAGVLVFALVGTAAQAPAASPGVPIIGGQYQPGDDAVVALVIGDQPSRDSLVCTGTLVSPHVVVAAAHCVAFGAPPDHVYFGSDPDTDHRYPTVAVSAVLPHPMFNLNTLDADISVVIMADAAPDGVTPYPIASQAPTPMQEARFVGFGCREIGRCGPYGEKYEVTTWITDVDPTDFRYGVATCSGDSGGPAFVKEGGSEVLAGVTSWGDAPCAEFGYDTRVDAYGDWVRQQITAVGDDVPTPTDDGGGGCCIGGRASSGKGGGWMLALAALAFVATRRQRG
jgi:secreted trypsin-like serine protease